MQQIVWTYHCMLMLQISLLPMNKNWYCIINSSNYWNFRSSLQKWDVKPLPDKTWVNLKVFFNSEQRSYKKIGGFNKNQRDTFYSANNIKELITSGVMEAMSSLTQFQQNNAYFNLFRAKIRANRNIEAQNYFENAKSIKRLDAGGKLST